MLRERADSNRVDLREEDNMGAFKIKKFSHLNERSVFKVNNLFKLMSNEQTINKYA